MVKHDTHTHTRRHPYTKNILAQTNIHTHTPKTKQWSSKGGIQIVPWHVLICITMNRYTLTQTSINIYTQTHTHTLTLPKKTVVKHRRHTDRPARCSASRQTLISYQRLFAQRKRIPVLDAAGRAKRRRLPATYTIRD